MKLLLDGPALTGVILISVLAFFGLLILIIILVKKHFTSLQIKKDDISEEELAKQELDRILVPIEDENIQKQMEEATLKDVTKNDAKKD
ncbi:MAG: hypothetical protein MJ221_00520 [Bacilli bacterium]|nr:hypothetical protein [Bacilli bacterium]